MEPSASKAKQLEERTVLFIVNVIKKIRPYSSDSKLRSVCNQLIIAATSVGANYAAANNSSSRADFKNKIFIAKKEIAETRYWLRLLDKVLPDTDFSELKQEALELNLIVQKIISTMKSAVSNGK